MTEKIVPVWVRLAFFLVVLWVYVYKCVRMCVCTHTRVLCVWCIMAWEFTWLDQKVTYGRRWCCCRLLLLLRRHCCCCCSKEYWDLSEKKETLIMGGDRKILTGDKQGDKGDQRRNYSMGLEWDAYLCVYY